MKRRSVKDFIMFDVTYVDGSRTSHRKVPTAALVDPNDEASVKAIIEAQDREIALASGRPRAAIKSVMRSRA